MKPKIKYAVNVLGKKKSMMKIFFTKKPCSLMNQRFPHSS